ncbi:MAG: TIR domain-containing protein [Lachnospiraceae bacterium]|nr:TIR domain-containing protein [Lachnospiraceae bacterium]
MNDNKKEGMYDRANHFRRNNDFDKAMSMYEQILNEDKTDAEAYWSIVLCRYGIEYVEDPVSHDRVPTVNRAQYTSVFMDEDYKEAIRNASVEQRLIFEKEAKTIDEIQKGILDISQKEEPFDVFICYKETDSNGNRTKDSVIANDLYYQLIKEGYKVFFAAITLEGKLGKAYEPYIFAAINSVKVMIVLGTKPEFFNAPWVKNEWSRYLQIIKKDPTKILIPAYKDMDPYDLPEEFSFLQAQDMNKIGFVNDIIHGIKKVINEQKNSENSNFAINGEIKHSNTGVDSLLERAFFFLEEGNWTNAMVYCEKALETNSKCSDAYLAKFMADSHIKRREEIAHMDVQYINNSDFLSAIKYASDSEKEKLLGYKISIQKACYDKYVPQIELIETEEDAINIVSYLDLIHEYSDTLSYIDKCNIIIENFKMEKKYATAVGHMNHAMSEIDYRKCYLEFKELKDFRDSETLAEKCRIEENNIVESDSGCAICRKNEGTRIFIPNNSNVLCCDNCFARMSVLQQNLGQSSIMVNNALAFLKTNFEYMGNQAAINRVRDIISRYEESVGEKDEDEEIENCELPEIDEEEQKEQEELFRRNQKLQTLAKNAQYEYDIQVVMDTPSGFADVEMIKYVIGKFSAEGWKLHTINMSGTNGAIGQTIIIFERRIKQQDD